MHFLFKWLIRLLVVTTGLLVTALLFIVLNYFMISMAASGNIIGPSDSVPENPLVLVPGAGNSEKGKWVNHTFEHRMEGARKIWEHDKNAVFFVSGMILPPYYDEAADMKERLESYGIGDENIISDSLGVRTWVSVEHAAKAKSNHPLVIVTQQEHLERALFCASCMGVRATGVIAEPPPYKHRYWTYREYAARVKATLDCVAFRLKIK
ncbi:MAG TPA: ElyC/SanA/YdcF family protein [Bacteroidia bacterium]|nr:ElyC/SanA/YdcF family protein [Bacteroidia bacterium]